jgi:hypothetical protein
MLLNHTLNNFYELGHPNFNLHQGILKLKELGVIAVSDKKVLQA